MPAAGDRPFARRIAAALVAERAPDPTRGDGGHDARDGAPAMDVLRASGGDAQAIAAGVIAAVFDDPSDAVRAATRLHRGVERDAPAWRIGIHVEDAVLTAEGRELPAMIDQAREMACVAQLGTTAVAAASLAALGPQGDVTIERLRDSGADERRVCLIVPQDEHAAPGRRRLVVVLAATAAFATVGGVAWLLPRREPASDGARLTVGIGPFLTSGLAEDDAWMAPALRDGVNAQLSTLSGVKVYSSEFIDFLIERQGLTTIEVANRLGIEKMLTGTMLMVGDTMRVETRIVDVQSGLLAGAHVASAPAADFLILESAVVLGVIARLRLRLSAEDEERIAGERATDVENLRLLLDAAGVLRSEPAPSSDGGPDSWAPGLLGPRAAYADEGDAAVVGFLEKYRRATEDRDLPAVAALYADFTPDQRAAVERYFANVRDLRIRIDRVEVAVVGDDAVASYTRTDDFVDVQTGRRVHVAVRPTRTLRRIDGTWRFAASR